MASFYVETSPDEVWERELLGNAEERTGAIGLALNLRDERKVNVFVRSSFGDVVFIATTDGGRVNFISGGVSK